MKLIAASDADAELVYTIKREAYIEYATRAYGLWDEALQRRVTRENLADIRLIAVEETIIGWVAVRRGTQAHEIVDLHIRPAHQRKGFGAQVVLAVIEEAGTKLVALGVLKANPARALYERLGFVATGETATHVKMKKPNQSLEPTTVLGTSAAEQPLVPSTVVAHL